MPHVSCAWLMQEDPGGLPLVQIDYSQAFVQAVLSEVAVLPQSIRRDSMKRDLDELSKREVAGVARAASKAAMLLASKRTEAAASHAASEAAAAAVSQSAAMWQGVIDICRCHSHRGWHPSAPRPCGAVLAPRQPRGGCGEARRGRDRRARRRRARPRAR